MSFGHNTVPKEQHIIHYVRNTVSIISNRIGAAFRQHIRNSNIFIRKLTMITFRILQISNSAI